MIKLSARDIQVGRIGEGRKINRVLEYEARKMDAKLT